MTFYKGSMICKITTSKFPNKAKGNYTGCIPAKLSCKQKPKLTQLRSVYALKEAFMRKQDW